MINDYFKYIKGDGTDTFAVTTDYNTLENKPFKYYSEETIIELQNSSTVNIVAKASGTGSSNTNSSGTDSMTIQLFNGKNYTAVLGSQNSINNATNSMIIGTNNSIAASTNDSTTTSPDDPTTVSTDDSTTDGSDDSTTTSPDNPTSVSKLSNVFAAGSNLTLKNSNTVAIGIGNTHTASLSKDKIDENQDYYFMVGNGSGTGRKNAFAVGNGFIDIGGTGLKDGATVGRITAKTAQELYLKDLTLHKLTVEAKPSESAVIDTDESNTDESTDTGETNTTSKLAKFILDPKQGLMMSDGNSTLKISVNNGLSFTTPDIEGSGCSITPNGLSIGGVSFIKKDDITNSITNGSVTISGNTIEFSSINATQSSSDETNTTQPSSNTGTIIFGSQKFTAADLVKSTYVDASGSDIGCPDGINWETIVIYTKTTVKEKTTYNSITVPKNLLGGTASNWRDSSGIVYALTLTNTDSKASINIVPSGGELLGATFF